MTTSNTQISARVERVLFPKDADPSEVAAAGSAFYIMRCDVGVCKGRLSHFPKVGEALVLDGAWAVSKFNGKPEFSFYHASVHVPADERALLRYACEMTSGFGPAIEEKIWNALGSDWRGLTADFPNVTPSKLAAFRKTIDFLAENSERAKVVSWLVSIGLTVNMAEAAFAKWGASTVVRVNENPYILARLPNYGFRDADTHIRRHFEIGRDDPRRIESALRYFLAQLTQEDTVVTWDALSEKVSATIDSDPDRISDACKGLFLARKFVPFQDTLSLTSARDFDAESGLYNFAVGSADAKMPHVRARQPSARDFDLSQEQMDAVQFALDGRFAIVNGGAGTGKTSIVRAICDSLRGNALLCSFAGKAAARLREASGHEASTIHRMLGWQGEERGFTAKTLTGKTVVLDEASMVSSDLMWEIAKRNPDRLVLVGDEAQLPPVGSGQPFHDLISVLPQRVRTLSVCYRNREAVFSSALAIREGRVPPPTAKSESESYEAVSVPDPRNAHTRVLDMVRRGEMDFDSDVILCCRNGESDADPCTVRSLNADIKAVVNPAPDPARKSRIDEGDRIICTQNSSELDVWNGTTGRCAAFDTGRAMWVDLDFPNAAGESSVLIPRDKVKDWTLAYALTVHKAQGSQYRRVLFLVTRRDAAVLLDRPMVYTAVTRARNDCMIMGDLGAYARAVATSRRKRTVIQELAR